MQDWTTVRVSKSTARKLMIARVVKGFKNVDEYLADVVKEIVLPERK
jgi:hypothetical protein